MSNKHEALRAKDLAEDCMRKKEFTTARRVANKARKMDPTLEDAVSRMIMVCDVNCAVLEKVGDELDWYKVLQVKIDADENTIKKQYRKLALLFHPDKNKLPGAEAAFKIVNEANSVLSSKDRRRLHDIRRKSAKKPGPGGASSSSQPPKAPTTGSVPQPQRAPSNQQAPGSGFFNQPPPSYQPPQQAPGPGVSNQRASSYQPPQQAPGPGVFNQRGFHTSVNTTWKRPEIQKKPQTQPTELGGGSSFWTRCAFCLMKSECSREHLNKSVNCRTCGKQYAAFQENFRCPPVQSTFWFSQQSKVPTQEAGKVAEKQPENTANVFSSKEGSRAKFWGVSAENTNGLPAETTFNFPQQSSKVPTQGAGKATKKQAEIPAKVSSSKDVGTSAENSNGLKKRKRIVESSDRSCSDSSNECKDVPAGKQDSGTSGGQNSRRSIRSKKQISYNENKNDDDKKEKGAESDEESNDRKNSHENHLGAETLPNGINRTKKIKADAPDAVIFECPDPDFTNFEKLREVARFKAGQTWAMYDDMDRMPRFYANIKKVLSKVDFKLQIQWLEAEPDEEKTVQWVRRKLPISVGKFKLAGVEYTNEAPSFSHQINCTIGNNNDVVRVYPQIGEIWALFKNWDIAWASGRRRSSHDYDYEFVEIRSEYSQGLGIKVAFLHKVQGFASVFSRRAPDTMQMIPPGELLRFSHRIPSTKLSGKEKDLRGKERDGVPFGSYELDTAALPQKKEEEEEEEEGVPILQEAAKSNQVQHRSLPSSDPDCVVIPSFDFHDFSAERLEGKFEHGQIWSLNSKEDGLPKCYAMIQKILWRPMFLLQINRLEVESLPENVAKWQDRNMPVSCGSFRLNGGRSETLTDVTGFSHQVKVQQHSKENKYTVLPKTGEIWAMYKNWSVTMKSASLKKCEYDVAEVLDETESYIEVLLLEKVKGFVSVFKEKVEGGSDVKMTIPRWDLMRFSHYVPAFRLTGEKDGALRGCVELDSSALPCNLRRS